MHETEIKFLKLQIIVLKLVRLGYGQVMVRHNDQDAVPADPTTMFVHRSLIPVDPRTKKDQ